MQNKLIQYFLNITPLTVNEITTLTESMELMLFKKGDYLVKEGGYHTDTYFILEGCVRQFKLVDGNDITTNFYTENEWIIAFESFEKKTKTTYNLICAENTQVVRGNEKKAQELFKQFPHLETVSRQVMEHVFMAQQKQHTAYITEKPEKRYLTLMATRPNIFQRIPQFHIASYLGVKPESLSRIRKKLSQK